MLKYFLDSGKIKDGSELQVSVDYFGNLIGKNNYRSYSTVIIQKSPNFSYINYTLANLFFRFHDKLPISNVRIFQDEEVEKIKLTIIASEIYQAIRRVSRNNPGEGKIYVFNNNQEVIDMVLSQLPGIKYKKCTINVEEKGRDEEVKKVKDKAITSLGKKISEVKSFLINAKESGTTSIKKKELRSQINISDKSNFTKILNELKPFLNFNHIENKGQQLVFK